MLSTWGRLQSCAGMCMVTGSDGRGGAAAGLGVAAGMCAAAAFDQSIQD